MFVVVGLDCYAVVTRPPWKTGVKLCHILRIKQAKRGFRED